MHVLILANNDGGLFKFRRELLERLTKKYEVSCCVPDGKYVKRLKSLGCQHISCSLLNRRGTNPLQEIRLLWYYRKILRETSPDIVLTYTIKPNVYGGMVCAQVGIPYIVNITGLGSAVENSSILQKITIPLYRYGLRKAKKVFFQNEANRDFMLQKQMVSSPYDVLPGSGVNLEHYCVLDYPQSDIVEFAFIARITKEKGIEEYLMAAKYFSIKNPRTRFHVCGACEDEYDEILGQLHNQKVIVYHREVEDVRTIHTISSCTIHPTYYPEGMSNVLLESCACGRPIITTDRPGCREIVEDGINGFIVKQRDSHDLIAKIEKFLALSWDERREMGLAGRTKVEREFDRQIVIKKYMREIEDGLQKDHQEP